MLISTNEILTPESKSPLKASIPTSPAPSTTTFLTFSACSFISTASSRFLKPTTLLALLNPSTGGMKAEAPLQIISLS